MVVIDEATGKELLRAVGHTMPVTTVAYAPNGRWFASGSLDRTVCLWDAPTGKLVLKLSTPNPVSNVRFSDDAKMLHVRENDQTQRDFDAATGKELRVISGQKAPQP